MPPRLTEPLRLGGRFAPSRVVFGAHETNLGWGRTFSERHVAYYERRATGGAGVVVTETASVHPSDWPYERAPLAVECESGWAAIATACQGHGSLVIASLGHAGGQGSSAYSQSALWAPSRVPEVNTREVPKWMEHDDIEAVIDGFVRATELAVAAGVDGVEIDAGPYSLVRQFLSGLTNQRDDQWGADRLLFARRVIEAVHSAGADDTIVGLRLSCDEMAPWAGIVPEAGADIATALCGEPTAPDLDYVTVTRGAIYTAQAARPDGHTEPGHNLGLAATVRDAVRAVHGERVAVIAQGSIVEWGQAEWAVGDGDRADAVEMTRALLADADLVAKVRAGTGERVRPCILCNQTCQVRDARNPIVTCVVDPRTGHELDDPDPEGAAASRAGGSETIGDPVTVVGGGVAGLEAGRVLALNGRRVRVVEREGQLGGMLRVAAVGAGRERLAVFADWLEGECRRLGVGIELNVELPRDALGANSVLATGSVPRDVEYRVTPAAIVIDAASLLRGIAAGEEMPDGPVLIWDPIGGPIGVSIAELLAARGCTVALATPDQIAGNELSRSGDLAPANARLQQAGVELHRRSILRNVKKGTAELEDRFSGETRAVPAAVVVDAGHRLPDPSWVDPTWAEHPQVGDAVAPRTILEAVLEARRVALSLTGMAVTGGMH